MYGFCQSLENALTSPQYLHLPKLVLLSAVSIIQWCTHFFCLVFGSDMADTQNLSGCKNNTFVYRVLNRVIAFNLIRWYAGYLWPCCEAARHSKTRSMRALIDALEEGSCATEIKQKKRIVLSGLFSPEPGSLALKPDPSSYATNINSLCEEQVRNELKFSRSWPARS